MNRTQFIGAKIQSGNDIFFAEEHRAISTTFHMMREVIEASYPIDAISLEMPHALQPLIDEVAAGGSNPEKFALEARIAQEQDYLDAAVSLFQSGRLSEEEFNGYEAFINARVASVLSGDGAAYTLEDRERDMEAYTSLHTLIEAASNRDVPVFATDI